MMRVLATVVALVWAAEAPGETVFAEDQVVRVATAEVPESAEDLAERLGKLLPEENAPAMAGEGVFAVSYAGIDPPRRFMGFLKEQFPEIDETAFRAGAPLNVSLVISDATSGAHVQLVMLLPKSRGAQNEAELFHEVIFGQPFPATAKILVSKAASASGPGNIVLSLKQSRDDATETYTSWLEDEGFLVEHNDRASGELILAQRHGMVAYLYFQDDPDRKGSSIMVLQHMEE